ncbi:MAG: thymidine phosphorylase [Firmicutes bacterium]|nr:thymidine phosphorylase [Bacillota bacterium]
MRAVDLIRKKRDGAALTDAELHWLIEAFTAGEVPDYQLTAFLMAVYFQGMTAQETLALTEAMLASGDRVPLHNLSKPKVDKHSTGGVGDKVTLLLAPLLASVGLCSVQLSGRGLGHTGGTADKLESIPGFQMQLDVAAFERVAAKAGCVVAMQSEQIAPADRRIYALRDVTATVESIPLITASIMSKKLAVDADALVLDVKVGRGAFMPDRQRAAALAASCIAVAEAFDRRAVALLTQMEQPLGFAVGNALEVREVIDALHGQGPSDLVALTLALGKEMLLATHQAHSPEAANAMLQAALDEGKALEAFRRWVTAQGGDARVADEPSLLPAAPVVREVFAQQSGHVAAIDALAVGHLAMTLGAGRAKAEDAVDPAVGIVLNKKVGDRVAVGEPLATLHLRTQGGYEASAQALRDAFQLTPQAVPPLPLVLGRVDTTGIHWTTDMIK